MEDSLSKRYLLYLRDMSRKIVYGAASSAGDYSQVLIRGYKKDDGRKFPRMTNIKLNTMINSSDGFKQQQDQENIGNGIFCGVGIIAGTYTKKVKGTSSLRLIAAPAINGQINFDEDDPSKGEIDEWIVNYDIASALIRRNQSEEDETYAAFSEDEDDITGNKLISGIEDELDKYSSPNIDLLDALSTKFIEGFAKLTETEFDYVENPMDALNSAIDAREITKIRKFYYCPRDWIFLAKVPEGLSTYQALNDLSKEKFA